MSPGTVMPLWERSALSGLDRYRRSIMCVAQRIGRWRIEGSVGGIKGFGYADSTVRAVACAVTGGNGAESSTRAIIGVLPRLAACPVSLAAKEWRCARTW